MMPLTRTTYTCVAPWLCLSSIVLSASHAWAQVSADGTLSTRVTSSDQRNFTIEGGSVTGTNLFHSFADFSVPQRGSAIFNNSLDIDNIFSRVTGANLSNIDGLIQANGSANLFLLNPNGIQFGAGASLNLGGSFFGSTADTLVFDDGTFSSFDPSPTPILSIGVPIGVQWNHAVPKAITLTNSTLALSGGEMLSLLGGDVNLMESTLRVPNGHVYLGGVSEGTTVVLENGHVPLFPDGMERGSVSLQNSSQVNVVGSGNGQIMVEASRFSLSESSLLAGADGAVLGGPATRAVSGAGGDIFITAENMVVGDRSLIANDVAAGSVGSSGDIIVNTETLSLTGGSRVQTVTSGAGDAGDIMLNANGAIEISGFTDDGLFSGVLSRSAATAPEPSGAGGAITVNTPGDFTIARRGFVGSVTNSTSDGGDIGVNVNTLVLEDGGQIATVTTSGGLAGDITINASESVRLSGESRDFVPNPFRDLPTFDLNALDFITEANVKVAESGTDGIPYVSVDRTAEQIISGTSVLGTAEAGVDYYSFSVTQGDSRVILDIDDGFNERSGSVDTNLSLFNLGTGELIEFNEDAEAAVGGEGSIEAFGTLSGDGFIDGSLREPGVYGVGVGVFPSNARNNALVDGVPLDVGDTYTLQVSVENQGTEGVVISDDPFNPENYNPTLFSNSGLVSHASGSGAGGRLTINTPQLVVDQSATVAAETLASGNGGDIYINALEGTQVLNDSRIRSTARGNGGGGRIQLETGRLLVNNLARLGAETFAQGDAGDVSVRATESVDLKDGSLRSIVEVDASGNGGSLTLETPLLTLTSAGAVNAETLGSGNAGTIVIQAQDIEVRGRRDAFASGIAADSFGSGDGGRLEIDTERLTIAEEGYVRVLSSGSGKGGSVTIRATDTVTIDGGTTPSLGTLLSSSVLFLGSLESPELIEAEGGDITVITDSLRLLRGGRITALTAGAGDAGTITIQANTIDIAEAGAIAPAGIEGLVRDSATGNGGRIKISAEQLRLEAGGQINASTSGLGDAGNIILNIDDVGVVGQSEDGRFTSQISAASNTTAAAGSIELISDTVRVSDGGTIEVSSLGGGDAGTLTIQANRLFLTDGGRLQAELQSELQAEETASRSRGPSVNAPGSSLASASASASGLTRLDSGERQQNNIILTIAELLLLDQDGLISARATGTASGGNIHITAPLIVGAHNSDLVASAERGNGGNIFISTDSLLGLELRDRLTPNSDITVSSELGLDGTVEISSPDVDPNSQTLDLPDILVDVSQLVRPGCNLTEGQFVLTGRGGLPSSPSDWVNGDRPWIDTRDLSALLNNAPSHVTSAPPERPVVNEPIQEATGIAIAEQSLRLIVSEDPLQPMAAQSHHAIAPSPTCTSYSQRS